MKELLQPEGVKELRKNPWSIKFVKFFIGNENDLIDVTRLRKKFSLTAEEKFEVAMAKSVCMKKIEKGVMEKPAEVSYAHALFVTKRLQSNFHTQAETLQTYLLSIPTDEGIAYLKILLEKEKAFSKEIIREVKG